MNRNVRASDVELLTRRPMDATNEREAPLHIGIMARSKGPYFSPISEPNLLDQQMHVQSEGVYLGKQGMVPLRSYIQCPLVMHQCKREFNDTRGAIPCMIYGHCRFTSKRLFDNPTGPERCPLIVWSPT